MLGNDLFGISEEALRIRVTPAGHPRLVSAATVNESSGMFSIYDTFRMDWREGIFILAAQKLDAGGSPSVRFWRKLAEIYLTGLCHIPGNAEAFEVALPRLEEREALLLTAPPMEGGEYLTAETLTGVWGAIDKWAREAIDAGGGLESFLNVRAPRWRQVGRVCFHLAENKIDAARPFAFMATYIAGFGASERLRHLPLRKALEQYAGEKNRDALINLLSPVQRASETLDWVRKLVESGEVYQPSAWPVERAYSFLRDAAALEDCGLSVRLPDWWKKRARPQVSVRIGETRKSKLNIKSLLDFDARVTLGGEALTDDELRALLAGEDGLVLLKGQWVEVDREKLRDAIDLWEDLTKNSKNGEISFIEGMRLLAGAPADLKDIKDDDAREWAHVSAGEGMLEILKGLRDPALLDSQHAVEKLNGELRPYQREGVAWLRFLTELGLGACLADDMGLGKTIQILALLLRGPGENDENKRAPSLLVVPASLLSNWKSEAARFAPSLKLVFLHPSETGKAALAEIEKEPLKFVAGADLAVTTYAMAHRQKWLKDIGWRLLILDEAQAIKNPSTRQSKAVKELPALARIALTGTPVENRLGDLWSLFDFLNPGLLGSAKVFKSFAASLTDRESYRFEPLRRLVGPYILRRMKTDKSIISDLPEKTEIIRYCFLTAKQVKLYEKVVKAMEEGLESSSGIARRGLILQALLRLKQVCNHPSQFSGDGDYKGSDSGKFTRVAEICEELAARQEKALVFTQFREVIDPLSEHLAGIFGRAGLTLHGGTSVDRRRGIVDMFQDEDGPPFIILSLKAGGTGLNLTEAAHVIHFDRWWNPAVENQATDRAFRIGQKSNVLVHKFVTKGTIEESIDAMIEDKRSLANEILSGEGEVKLTELSDEELLRLVRLDVNRAADN